LFIPDPDFLPIPDHWVKKAPDPGFGSAILRKINTFNRHLFLFPFVQVNGAVVNVRGKADKLAVWLADSSQPDSILRIGKMLKERLNIDPGEKIGFTVHQEEKAKGSSMKKQRHYV
jgi:hypothetical protein